MTFEDKMKRLDEIVKLMSENKLPLEETISIFEEGQKLIKELKEKYNSYNGIFIEIEKLGLGENEEENIQRERRAKFYEQLGFVKLHNDLELYKVIYSPYVLFCTNIREDDKKIINDIFKIYNQILGEKRINKNCKVLTNM